ncbi:hypothetical protein GDO86_001453 [Hymenochirus boettgeri]|uniref:Putative WW-binding domain-containing protein n=1 Tax=Hymenochirus boettgeri TaxID=247094 RepID=A0A8T2KIL8_9PIPI|nr:hypothetical protein GDO86_001453 [Hymenochirus boettgeri]
MAKRRAEQQVDTVPPPCKKLAWGVSIQCGQKASYFPPRRKRTLTPDPEGPELTSPLAANKDHPREDRPAIHPPIPRKKGRSSEITFQNDEEFKEFNSFNYWRTPLPEIDLSEITTEAKEGDNQIHTKEILEDMDS